MAKRHEFKVVLDGVDLSPQTVDAISQAVQKAALAHLATGDAKGDFATSLLSGSTRGIRMVAMDAQQVQALGLQETAE